MRDVNRGWLIRYTHSTEASLFFVSVYLHMFRGIMYGSFKRPRELVWILGIIVFLHMIPSFFGIAFWGVLAMGTSILLLLALLWIDRGQVRSVRYRGSGFRVVLGIFAAAFLGLELMGSGVIANAMHAGFPDANVTLWTSVFGRLMVAGYFGFFVFLWIYTRFRLERIRPVPERMIFNH